MDMTQTHYPDYLGLLVAGQIESLVASLSSHPVLNDPAGRFEGSGAVFEFLKKKAEQLRADQAKAEHVRLTGFSWKAGYHYLPYAPTTIRGHVESDRRGLRALLRRYPGQLSGAILKPQGVAA